MYHESLVSGFREQQAEVDTDVETEIASELHIEVPVWESPRVAAQP